MRHFSVALLAIAWALIGSAAVAASSCKLVKVAEWPVRPGGGVPLVEGAINGERVGVMLDTGSNTSLLRSSADRLGLTRQAAKGPRAFGVGGETYLEATYIDEFRIDQTVEKNWRVMVAGDGSLRGVDVILGEDFFEKFDVEFDLPHNTVRLFQPKDCQGVSLAYWATPIGSLLPRRTDLTPPLLLGADFLRAHRVLVAQSQHKLYFTYEGGPVFQPRRPREPPRASPPEAAAPGAETK